MKLAILGGTGAEGRGLALRFASAGHEIAIGSRQVERAERAASELSEQLETAAIVGRDNRSAAENGEVVILAVPDQGLAEFLDQVESVLEGKIVVSTIAPIEFAGGRATPRLTGESAAEMVQRLLPRSRIVAAFHHVSARLLARLERSLDEDVLICGDDAQACELVASLAEQLPGVRAVSVGALANAALLESITPLLLNINRLHKTNAGIRITGLQQS